MRQPDASIPATEKLYRRFREHHVDADRVLPDGFDSQGSSCDRQAYQPTPESMRDATYPHVAEILVGKIPAGIVAAPNTWEFFAKDEPIVDNEAHCEVRVRRVSRRPREENDPKFADCPKLLKLELKSRLAAEFAVI